MTVSLTASISNPTANEYIRLVGFGNAAGLLAEKGFGGLMGLKQNAIDIDDLMKMKAKQEQKEKPDDNQDE